MDKTKRKMIIGSVQVIKSGKSTKNGKTFDWTIYEVRATSSETNKDGVFSTFDDFRGQEGMEVEVMIWLEKNESNGKTYENWKMEKPRRNIWEELDNLKRRMSALEKVGEFIPEDNI